MERVGSVHLENIMVFMWPFLSPFSTLTRQNGGVLWVYQTLTSAGAEAQDLLSLQDILQNLDHHYANPYDHSANPHEH
jgi:hypothetical protein